MKTLFQQSSPTQDQRDSNMKSRRAIEIRPNNHHAETACAGPPRMESVSKQQQQFAVHNRSIPPSRMRSTTARYHCCSDEHSEYSNQYPRRCHLRHHHHHHHHRHHHHPRRQQRFRPTTAMQLLIITSALFNRVSSATDKTYMIRQENLARVSRREFFVESNSSFPKNDPKFPLPKFPSTGVQRKGLKADTNDISRIQKARNKNKNDNTIDNDKNSKEGNKTSNSKKSVKAANPTPNNSNNNKVKNKITKASSSRSSTRQPKAPNRKPTDRPTKNERDINRPSTRRPKAPNRKPTDRPTKNDRPKQPKPSNAPTPPPSLKSSTIPTDAQTTDLPTPAPSKNPTENPSMRASSVEPSAAVVHSTQPSRKPLDIIATSSEPPSENHSRLPSIKSSGIPSGIPSAHPESAPTTIPFVVEPSSEDPSGMPVTLPERSLSIRPSIALLSTEPSTHQSNTPSGAYVDSIYIPPSISPSVNNHTMEPSTNRSAYPSIGTIHAPTTSPEVNSTSPTISITEYHSQLPSTIKSTVSPVEATTIAPSTSSSINPSNKPSVAPQAVPSTSPSTNPITFIPTKQRESSFYQTRWSDSSRGTIEVRLSIMIGYHNTYPEPRDAPMVEYSIKKNKGLMLRTKRITADDILSGREPELLNDVLTSMITVFCTMLEDSEYIIIAPASAYNSSVVDDRNNEDMYVNCCVDDPLLSATAIPQSLYDESNTVLLADLTGDKGTFDVLDQDMLIMISDDKIENLDWIEWGISYNVMNVGNLLLQDEGGNFNNAITTSNDSLNKSLMNAWSAGIVDNVFKSKNSMVVTTSMVGSERYTFTKAISDAIEKDQNDDGDLGTDNDIGSITNNNSNENDGEGDARIDAIQVAGIILFITMAASATFVIKIARKRGVGLHYNTRWDATLMDASARIPYIIGGDVRDSDSSVDSCELKSDYTGTCPMSSESNTFENYGCLV